MKETWKYLFSPQVLSRGEDYYYGDEVRKIKKTDYGYSAEVRGENKYEVDIYINGDEVDEMDCTCPYAAKGYNCKHMAAVLFALEDQDFVEESEPENRETIDDILARLDEKTILTEFRNILEENVQLHDRFYNKYRRQPADRKEITRINGMLDDLAYEYGDRGGFVDWYHGSDYVRGFLACLEDYVEPMIERGEYLAAFEVLKHAFYVVNTVDMDGSNGEHSDIVYHIEELWTDIIQHADANEKDQIHQWFESMLEKASSLNVGDSIADMYYSQFNDEKYLLPILKETKDIIQDPSISAYALKDKLDLYKSVLERLHQPLNEYNQWLQDHRHIPSVKEILLKEAEDKKDIETCITLSEELLNTEDVWWRKNELARKLLKYYRENGDKEKYRDTLKRIVLEGRTPLMEDIRILRNLYAEEEWIPIREEIVKKDRYIAKEIFFEERLYDRLWALLKMMPVSEIEPYLHVLRNEYADELLERYSTYLHALEERHGTRTVYEEMEKYLHLTASIPGGKKEAYSIISQWQKQFPTRKAMQQMLINVMRKL
ncbi:MAG: SWIM zinc finger family protein [Solobacterium sp.]|nr:SWIM zinc finger family protein [Solobacterium sp.]